MAKIIDLTETFSIKPIIDIIHENKRYIVGYDEFPIDIYKDYFLDEFNFSIYYNKHWFGSIDETAITFFIYSDRNWDLYKQYLIDRFKAVNIFPIYANEESITLELSYDKKDFTFPIMIGFAYTTKEKNSNTLDDLKEYLRVISRYEEKEVYAFAIYDLKEDELCDASYSLYGKEDLKEELKESFPEEVINYINKNYYGKFL